MQVREFLHPYAVRKPPQHWWCKAPIQPPRQAPQAAPKRTPKAGKKPTLKAASVPAKNSFEATAAKQLQAPVTQRGRVTKLPARLAAEAAADMASSADEGTDSTAGRTTGAAAKSPKKKPRKSAVKHRSSNKTAPASHAQLGAVPSQATELANNLGDTSASGPSVLSAAVQPQASQPVRAVLSKQKKSSVPRKGVSQLVGDGSGFLAKALGQLKDDGHLLEALQDLLAAMPKAEFALCERDTTPFPDSSAIPQAAPSNLGHGGSTSVPEVKLATESKSLSAGAAELLISPESMSISPAAKAEEHRVPVLGLLGPEAAPVNAGQPADTGHSAAQPKVQPAAGRAPAGQALLAKQLKGGAAVLAKILGLNMLATSHSSAKTGTPALQSGQAGRVLLHRDGAC